MRIWFSFLVCFFLGCEAWFSFFKPKSEVKISYDGYQIFRITEVNVETKQFLGDNDRFHLTRRKELGIPGHIDARIRPSEFGECRPPACTIFIDDLGAAVKKSMQNAKSRRNSGLSVQRLQSGDVNQYYRYEEIVEYLHYLDDTVDAANVDIIGRSYEGRPLVVLRISSGGDDKPAIFLDGGMHGREWLSPAAVLYVVRELAENSLENRELLEDFDWYFLPVANPDGYEFSHTTDRFWRKNRSMFPSATCRGVDLNRNFDFDWGNFATSRKPCSDTHGGPKPFSEPETKAFATYLSSIPNLQVYIGTHNYGQYILIPYGSGPDKPSNYLEMHALALTAATAIKRMSGKDYLAGNIADLVHPVSGGACDWVKRTLNVTFAYSIELRGTDSLGFLTPPEEIIPSGMELFTLLKVVSRQVKSNVESD